MEGGFANFISPTAFLLKSMIEMKKYIGLLFIGVLLIIVGTCCTGNEKKCLIQGHTSFKTYSKAYLLDTERRPVDSVIVNDGNFTFTQPDSTSIPYVMIIRLDNGSENDWLEMPVMIEHGMVKLQIEEYVHISGTPLNNAIQDFLDGIQRCKDGIVVDKDITPDEVEQIFSEYYCQQILANRDNALGRYIYQDYGIHLTKDDMEKAKTALDRE